jgi:hypothetical protein
MKPFVMLFVVLAAAFVRADDSALVKAAKKVPPGTVITNETVKKDAAAAAGTAPATTTAAPAPARSPLVVQAEQKQQRAAAEARLHNAEEAAGKLETELAAVELSYYDESDPDVRDREITRRFALTQQKLEAAKKELTAARAGVAALPPSNVTVLPLP